MLLRNFTKSSITFIISLAYLFSIAENSIAAPAIAPNSFGQAQSFIADLDGAPLVSGNWEGRFRPYRLEGDDLLPLIKPHEDKDFLDYDFYSPTPLENGILMSAQKLGRGQFDLVYYDLQQHTLQFVIDSTEHDEGNYCISPRGLVSFRQDRQQRVSRLHEGKLKILTAANLPGFARCLWLDEHRFLGATNLNPPLDIHECYSHNAEWLCKLTPLGNNLHSFVGFYQSKDGETGLLGLSSTDEFRRAYAFNSARTRLDPSTKNPPMKGDVLEIVDNIARVGFHSRYWATSTKDSRTTVFRLKKIDSTLYAIAATDRDSKTLAILEDDHWRLLHPPNSTDPSSLFPTSEIWLPSADGTLVQAFYFGPPTAKKFVLWLHGGPRENVSPRFNPYFKKMNDSGFAVLALNYPGSTGRGRPYELQSRDITAQRKAVAAAFEFFAQHHAEQVVGWSVSAGSNLLYATLRQRLPYTALVDQAGFRTAAIQTLASSINIPLLTVRGENDIRSNEAQLEFDYVYAGGHDITYLPYFQELFRRFDKMIADKQK